MPERTKRRRTWRLVLGVPVSAIVFAWGLHAWALARSEAEIRTQIAKLSAIGLDLGAASRSLTDHDRLLWTELKALAKESKTCGPLPSRSQLRSAGDLATRLKHYVDQSDHLYLTLKSKSLERARFPVWETGVSPTLSKQDAIPERFGWSSATTLGQLSGIAQARADHFANRNWDTSLDALGTSLRLLRMGTGAMVLIQEDEVWLQILRLRHSANLDTPALNRTLSWIEAHRPNADLSLTYAAETSGVLELYRATTFDFGDFDFGDYRSIPEQLAVAWRSSALNMNWAAVHYLRTTYENLMEHSKDFYSDSVRMQKGHPAQKHGTARLMAQLDTHARMAYIVYWLETQRIQTGKWPDQLPDEPRFQDGYTGKTFHYSSEGNTFVLRSLGPNQSDDLGAGDDLQVSESSP